MIWRLGVALGKVRWLARETRRKTRKTIRRLSTVSIKYDDRMSLTWEEAVSQTSGYGAAPITEKVRLAAREVIEGRASFDRDGTVFRHPEYNWPLLAFCGIVSSLNESRLKVLDFGGSLGTAFLQNRRILAQIGEADWRIVEQEHLVKLGRSEVNLEGLSFFSSLDEASTNFRPSLSYLGSSLQYIENPIETLQEIGNLTDQVLILDRLPLHESESRLVKQIVPKQIYEASYPMRILSQEEIENSLSDEWALVSSHECVGGTAQTVTGLTFQWRGLVFWKKQVFVDLERTQEAA